VHIKLSLSLHFYLLHLLLNSCDGKRHVWTSLYAPETVQLLQKETPDFIPPDLCPPNSLDLNPVDYRIWGLMQEHVYTLYKTPVRDTSDLKQRLTDIRASMSQKVIDEAVDHWRMWSRASTKTKGHHFDHLLN